MVGTQYSTSLRYIILHVSSQLTYFLTVGIFLYEGPRKKPIAQCIAEAARRMVHSTVLLRKEEAFLISKLC